MKRQMIFYFFLLMALVSNAQMRELFSTDFQSDDYDWEYKFLGEVVWGGKPPQPNVEIGNGSFKLKCKDKSAFVTNIEKFSIDHPWELEIGFVFKTSEPKIHQSFGMVIGGTDVLICYITTDGGFCIGNARKSKCEEKPFKGVELFGRNILKVVHRNAGLYIYINGQKVDEKPAPNALSGRKIGFYSPKFSDVEVDYIKVSQNIDAPFVKPKKTMSMTGGIGYSVVDHTGKKLSNKNYQQIWGFIDGVAKVKFNDKYGYVDSTGKEIVPCVHFDAKDFRFGSALACKNEFPIGNKKYKHWLYTYYDKSGKKLTPLHYALHSGQYNEYGVAMGIRETYHKSTGYTDHQYMELIGTNGKVLIPYTKKYERFEYLPNDRIIMKHHYWDLFDIKGNRLNSNTYARVKPYSDGLLMVRKDTIKVGGSILSYGIMDLDGKEILKPIFHKITDFEFNNNTLAKVYFNRKLFFYIDRKGKCTEFDGVACPEE